MTLNRNQQPGQLSRTIPIVWIHHAWRVEVGVGCEGAPSRRLSTLHRMAAAGRPVQRRIAGQGDEGAETGFAFCALESVHVSDSVESSGAATIIRVFRAVPRPRTRRRSTEPVLRPGACAVARVKRINLQRMDGHCPLN